MNPKMTIFISSALTAFVMAILGGVVSAMNNPAQIQLTQAVEQAPAQPSEMAAPIVEEVFVQTPDKVADTLLPLNVPAPVIIGPEQAVRVAMDFLKQEDVYSVETSTYDGKDVFKVTFSSGDIVIVSPQGDVITTTKLQPVVVQVEPTKPPKTNTGGGNGGSNTQINNNSTSGSQSSQEQEHEEEHQESESHEEEHD